jgi:hypothetical protein
VLVTALAQASDMSDADYRAIYDQLATGRPRPKYLRPCLSPDPRKRLAQLTELIAQTQQAIEAAA